MTKKPAKRIPGKIGSTRKRGNTHILVPNILEGGQMGATTHIYLKLPVLR
jgi:hypothetical protein